MRPNARIGQLVCELLGTHTYEDDEALVARGRVRHQVQSANAAVVVKLQQAVVAAFVTFVLQPFIHRLGVLGGAVELRNVDFALAHAVLLVGPNTSVPDALDVPADVPDA
eukprot:1752416-Pleurochrysis_carterae.AAC.1